MESLHQAVSTIGCFDFYIALFLCGIDTERHGPDWHSVAVSGNIFYPRTLVHAMPDIDGDNFGVAEVKCYDPLDCAPANVPRAWNAAHPLPIRHRL